MSKSLKDSEEVMNSTARISAREHSPGKLAEMVIFYVRKIHALRTIDALRTIVALRTISGPLERIFFFLRKKKNGNFCHENEAKNRCPSGASIVRGA